MSKLGVIGVAIAVFLAVIVASCSVTTINSGHVGIKVANWGSNVGVDPKPLGVGWHMTPPGVDIYEYPIYNQTYAWTKKTSEENPVDESFDFQDKTGLTMSADVSVLYRVNPTMAPKLFQTYRQEMPAIVAGPLRNKIRSMLNENSSHMNVEEIMGPRKTELIDKTLKDVRAYFTQQGLEIDQLYWASAIQLPNSIRNQINAKIANEQQALAAQANVATVEANARAEVARAEGKAKAMQIEAQAIASNPQILELRKLEKWNGEVPQFVAAGTPMIAIGK